MALGFSPPKHRARIEHSSVGAFTKEEVMIMSDYEILAIVLMIITLAFAIHNASNRDK